MKIESEKLNEAILALTSNYSKVITIVLHSGMITPICIPPEEYEVVESEYIRTLNDYVEWFTKSQLIHPDDVDAFKEFMSKVDKNMHLIYRRKVGTEWHVVIMETYPTVNYGDTYKEVQLYVRDIDTIYQNAYNAIMLRMGTTDDMTGLYNRTALYNDIRTYDNFLTGVMFADLNGLKYTNDHYGHAAGDELIIKFANLLSINFDKCKCYHVSGDEFVVLSYECPIREFIKKVNNFHTSMWNTDMPLASIGYSVAEPGELMHAYRDAEKLMYDDKRVFYIKFPDRKR